MAEVNKEELRRLAEACVCGDWFKSGDLRHFDDKTGDAHGLNAEDDRLIAAADPRRILSLLDENAAQAARIAELERECERLRKEVDKRIKQGQDNHEMLNGALRQNAELRGELSVLRSSEAHELSKLRAELESCRKDAERYRWLTEDHDDRAKREARREICERLPVMSYSAASDAIDAAMQEGGV